jgi:hypothetical protein
MARGFVMIRVAGVQRSGKIGTPLFDIVLPVVPIFINGRG